MKNDVYYIREYQDGDEVQIIKLFKSVFGQERKLDDWRWMFKENPFGKIYAALSFTRENDELIAQYTVVPTPLNHNGNKAIGCQSVDTMVHPDFRKYGLFVKTAEYCYEELKKDGIPMVYGFPNHNSYPGFMRKLKWERIEYQNRYFQRLGSYRGKILGSKLLGKTANRLMKSYLRQILSFKCRQICKKNGKYALHFSQTVPEGYEKLWHSLRSYDVYSVWKDSEYFQWRYDNNLRNDYSYAYLVREGDIVALAVYNAAPSMTVCELMAKQRNVDYAQLLLYHICYCHAKGDAKGIAFWGSDQGFFDEVFSSFERSKSFYRVLCLRAFQDGKPNQDINWPNSWTVTHGDTDLI